MKLPQHLHEVFSVRVRELPRVGWLLLHSLLIGIFSAFLLSTANALFLERFGAAMLPYGYIASAALGLLTIRLFASLGQRLPLGVFLICRVLLPLVLVAGLWLGLRVSESRWLVFLLFVSFAPSITLLNLVFWDLASRLFDLRQGKRLFGLVTSGEMAAGVLGFFLVPVLLRFLPGPADLLLISVASLVLCVPVVWTITRRFLPAVAGQPLPAVKKARSSLGTLLKDRYFSLIALLMTAFVLVLYLIDFSFLSQLARFEGSSGKAEFIAVFFGTTKFFQLVAKVLSGRLLGQFGLRFGLLSLPCILLASVFLASLAGGGLGAQSGPFFLLVVFSAFLWLVLNRSIFEPSFKVLYQPLPGPKRMIFQDGIEGTVRQLGILFAGALLILITRNGLTALHVFYILIPILAAWILVAGGAHREYRTRLIGALSAGVQKAIAVSPLELLRKHLREVLPEDLEGAVTVLARVDPPAVEPQLLEMLDDEDPSVQVASLRYLRRLRIQTARPSLERLAAASQVEEVREAAAAALWDIGQVVELSESPDRLAEMISSDSTRDRGQAASALALNGGRHDVSGLVELLWDENQGVRRAALVAAGFLGRPELWPRVINQLAHHRFANAAGFALITIGEAVLPDLERAFGKAGQSLDLQLRILRIYEHLGGPEAQALLLKKLRTPNREVRRRALTALSLTGFQAGEERDAAVESEIELEVGNMFWNKAALRDLGDDSSFGPVREALEIEIEKGRTSLLLLLSLLFDPRAIRLVEEGLEAGTRETMVYAIEILDILVSPELKPMVLPAVEALPPAQFLKRLETFFYSRRLEPVERLQAIAQRDPSKIDRWTQACALGALGAFPRERVARDLTANLGHPEKLIQEVAAAALYQFDPAEYRRIGSLLAVDRKRLDQMLGIDGTGTSDEGIAPRPAAGSVAMRSFERRSIYGRVLLLRRVDAFSDLPPETLLRMAATAEDRELGVGEILRVDQTLDGSVYVVAAGRLKAQLRPDEGVLEKAALVRCGARATPVRALKPARLLHLPGEHLCELMADHVELVPALLAASGSAPSPQQTVELSGLWIGETTLIVGA